MLHRRYLNFTYEALALGLRAGFLSAVFCLIYVKYSHQSLNFILAVIGVFIVSIIETMALNLSTSKRALYGAVISITAGITTALGSMVGANPLLLSLLLILFMLPVGLASSGRAISATTVLFIANLFIIGSGMPALPQQAIMYGLYFTGGGLALVASGYIQFIFYKNKYDKPDIINGANDGARTQDSDKSRVFSINQKNLKFALMLAIAVCGANAIAGYLKLPQQYCAPMTALLILKADHDFSKERIKHRFFGTLFGSVLAAGLILLIHDKLILAVLMFPIMFFIVVSLARHYGAYVFFLTSMITILFNLIDSSGILTTEERALFTFLGIVTVVLVIYLSKVLFRYFNKTSD